ncbi:MAG TPA: hypothetical protein VM070_08580 [Candidatus Saccharimonadales bacterium]|nr:hypothetical protein [Candidatus Saccharimonadales bacterium]
MEGSPADAATVDECVTFVEEATSGLRDDGAEWGPRLDAATERIAAALQWTVDHATDPQSAERGMRIATALHGYWLRHGQLPIARSWLVQLLAAPGAQARTAMRARALNAAGQVAFRQGERDVAHARFQEALGLATELQETTAVVAAITNLARIALRDGDAPAVRRLAAQARERAASLDDPAAGLGPLHLLAAGTRMAGELEAAKILYRESLDLNRALGRGSMITTELLNLGSVEKRLGHAAEAARLFTEALDRALATADEYTAAPSVLGLAGAAALLGDAQRGGRLLGGARALYTAAGLIPDPDDAEEEAWTVELIRNAVGQRDLDDACAAGARLSRDELLHEARSVAPARQVLDTP